MRLPRQCLQRFSPLSALLLDAIINLYGLLSRVRLRRLSFFFVCMPGEEIIVNLVQQLNLDLIQLTPTINLTSFRLQRLLFVT